MSKTLLRHTLIEKKFDITRKIYHTDQGIVIFKTNLETGNLWLRNCNQEERL
jgi:hypothetical protein